MNARARTGIGTPHRGGLVARATAAVLLLAGVGPVAAQVTSYGDLNAVVPGLASQLVANDRLKGKKVLVNAHDFFEEGTRRNLPLSETLRQRFRTELSNRGVEVFALPEGSEDEMVILQGVWRELPEPGARPESRKIDLVVSLIERTTDGQRVLPAARGRVDAVEEVLLTPDLDSWGRHVVRELETRAGGRGRRVVHVRNVQLYGAARSEAFERYLVRRWLLPAFSQSRLFRLAEIGGEESEGVLDMDVFAYAGRVEIALNVWDRGVQTASASIEMVQGLLPEHYFRGTGTAGQGTGTAVATPNPGPEDDETPSDEVTALLAACAAHERAHRLTMPPGANAADCYAQVLERDPGNAQAQAGLNSIRELYAKRVQGMIDRGRFDKARGMVEQLGKMKRRHPWVEELGARIETAQAQRLVERAEAAIERGELDEASGVVEQLKRLSPEHPRAWELEEKIRTAKERWITEITPEMVRIEGGCFQMGSPGSETGRDDDERRHEVCVEAFSTGKHEMTFAKFDRFAAATGRERPDDRGWGRGRRPVINVSWDDATAYARWLSRETGRRYRLPTEAEWEYAARAGSTTAYPWGNHVGSGRANCRGCGSRWDDRQTAPVGSFDANAWGLHDTVGNVWEWTCSEYDKGYGGGESRCASGSVGRRVIRGGSWDSDPGGVRSAYRTRYGPGTRYYTLGFRLAQD